MTSGYGDDKGDPAASSQRIVGAYDALDAALLSFTRGDDQSGKAARHIEELVLALREVRDERLEALGTELASVVPTTGEALGGSDALVRVARDTLHELGDHELCLHQVDWPPMIPNYTRVRVTTDRLASEGVPRGAVGTVVDIYGPIEPPATVRSRFRGYEVEVPGAAGITVSVSDAEVEPFG